MIMTGLSERGFVMDYRQYKDQRQAEFNALPIFFAFGRDQFKEAMAKRGLKEKDTDKIYRLGDTGGYYLKSDADVVRAFFKKKDDLPELMKDQAFAVDAFYSEMCNHEFGINSHGDWDVCSCFGNCDYVDGKKGTEYLTEMGYSDQVCDCYQVAKGKYFKMAFEHDWF